mgnify:FL=1
MDECKRIWIENRNRWGRKFEDEVVKLYPWEKMSYMDFEYRDNDGRIFKERDSYDEDIVEVGYWIGCRCFKFTDLYISFHDVMVDGKVKREKYSYLNYGMKGKWVEKREMSYDVVRNLREEDYEKVSLNSKMG